MTKTNALRILEREKIAFTAREYDISDGEISGPAVAAKMGQEPDRVFKTLVTEGKNSKLYVFVLPSSAELDLKKAAAAADEKQIRMIKSKDLEPKTGYIHGGCSPVGMKKAYTTFIEESAQLFETVFVSGGKIGLQVELSPNSLINLCGAAYADLC